MCYGSEFTSNAILAWADRACGLRLDLHLAPGLGPRNVESTAPEPAASPARTGSTTAGNELGAGQTGATSTAIRFDQGNQTQAAFEIGLQTFRMHLLWDEVH